jgi:phosphoribosylanthranilate isomerase
MWVKICGMTTAEAVHAAVAAGVDAIGFVFAPSKRQVNVEQALRLSRDLPRGILRVAVLQHPSQALIDEVCSIFKPDVLQTDVEDLPTLAVPTALKVLPVVRAGRFAPEPLPIRMLFEGPVSGAGETADWARAAELATKTELVLAGGLSPANVAQAIAKVRPFGVDVSSGVEASPGLKDVEKIAAFVKAARNA